MDNFIDKITSRFAGQDAIKANAEAEALEMRKLKSQAEVAQKSLAHHDALMQEMRKLNLRNTESAKVVAELIEHAQAVLKATREANEADNGNKNDEIVTAIDGKVTVLFARMAETDNKLIAITDKINEADKVLQEIRELMSKGLEVGDLKSDLEGTVHKENVKVYRNVQAALLEETSKLTETLKEDINGLKGLNKPILILLIVSLVIGLGNLGLIFAQLFGLF